MNILSDWANTQPEKFSTCKSGEAFEGIVYDALIVAIETLGQNAKIDYQKGGHRFPDIIIKYSQNQKKFGIEVKASTSSTSAKSWKINGNSVLGSTKDRTLEEVFLLFGKTALTPAEFRIKRYEDAISDVAVTHSPRYIIDMDLSDTDTFFQKSGISYNAMNEADDPIGLITEYYRSQGLKAWWLSESAPAVVRVFNDLTRKEQNNFIGEGFALFPEIFSNSQRKFYNLGFWATTERSIICPNLRDCYTAGGRTSVTFNGNLYLNLPQIFNKLKIYMREVRYALDNFDSKSLTENWNTSHQISENIEERLELWASLAKANAVRILTESETDNDALFYDILKEIINL